jgi:dTMP kinase
VEARELPVKKGLLITFEGPDGSGKTTQVQRLAQHVRTLGYPIVQTREPGGTAISEKIREVILDVSTPEMDDVTEALLYAAARAQHVSQVIRPALLRGDIVVCDRFVDSSIAYQGFGRGLGAGVASINAFAVQGVKPDLTFFLDIEPAAGLKRISRSGGLDRLEKETLAFHKRVYEGYQELIAQNKERYRIVDAGLDADAVAEEIQSLFDVWMAE